MFASETPTDLEYQASAEETQGFDYAELGTRTHIVQWQPTQLKAHPRNKAIYGNEDVSALVEHIRLFGWVKPLVCNPNKTIISGHRRWKAALELRLESIPVEVREFPNETAELEALLLENASRNKTTEQKVREAEAWKEVEAGEAKRRQLAAQNNNAAKAVVENFPQLLQEKGKTRDAIANRVGLGSGRNYEKAAKVVTVIDEEASLGHIVLAQALRSALNNQSIDAAHTLLKKSPEERFAIAKLIINGDAKSTKQAERMIKKENLNEFNAPTGQATAGGASIAEPQVTVNSNGDDVDDTTQSEKEQSGKNFYKPVEELVEVVDKFNFSSNGHPNPLGSDILVASSTTRNHPDTTDVSVHKSANTPRSKVESEISEICDVIDNIFATVQHFNNQQKDEVFERLVDYIGAENLGEVVVKFMHQYELPELCHKCFCAMNEETFSGLKVEQIKLSGLSDEAIKFLNEETSQLLKERQLSKPWLPGEKSSTFLESTPSL